MLGNLVLVNGKIIVFQKIERLPLEKRLVSYWIFVRKLSVHL